MLRSLSLIAVAFGLSGCFVPTPVSVVSMGADVVSFVFSGKTVTDHGISLALDEDCALMGVLEGEICDDQPHYREANVALALAPLPRSQDIGQLADGDAQVLASAQRASLVFGDTAPLIEGLVASAAPGSVPLPTRRPTPQSTIPDAFLADNDIAPDVSTAVAYQVAEIAPAAGAPVEPIPMPVLITDAGITDTGPDVDLGSAPFVAESPAFSPRLAAQGQDDTRSVAAASTAMSPRLTATAETAQDRFNAAKAGTEIGLAPTVLAEGLSRRKAGTVAKRFNRSATSEMGG